jgi:hypothetical protein
MFTCTYRPFLRYAEGEVGGAVATPATPTAPVVPPTITPETTTSTTTGTGWDGKVESLDAGVQKIIADLRKEAGDHRVAAKTAGEAATKDLTERLAVALGLKPDAATDPATLTASLTAAQQSAKGAARELAIFKAASASGADPSKLLDSNTFTTSVAGLDPTDSTAITAAIEAAVAANPLLKTTRAVGASGIELGGSGDSQITEAQLAQMTPEQVVLARKEGRLAHLL